VISSAPSPAETALNKKEYGSSESLFRATLAKNSKDDIAHEGLVRALIGQDKVVDAVTQAETWAAAEPGSSMAAVALGEARLRHGDPAAALLEFQRGVRADKCNARALFGIARVDELEGKHATAKWMIEQAYALQPSDAGIHAAWISTRPHNERLEKESSDHSPECKMSPASPREATIPMAGVLDGINRILAWGLDVQFNGKQRLLEIDTGASGIVITRGAALFLGITREDATLTGGIGDKGNVNTSIAHVASIKIGAIEFTNCPVQILEKWNVVDADGLIGGDVFEDSLLTLDFPKQELRIAPLPRRLALSGTQIEDQPGEAYDPYVAPGMAKWNSIYRSGHDLLMRTRIVETKRVKDESAWKERLFLLDTGSGANFISPAAAAEVTKVSRDRDLSVSGISGKVNEVYLASKFTLDFAGLRLNLPNMRAIDTT
jgi:predicted aspartyl protease